MLDVFLSAAVVFVIHVQTVPFLISGSLSEMCSGSFQSDATGLWHSQGFFTFLSPWGLPLLMLYPPLWPLPSQQLKKYIFIPSFIYFWQRWVLVLAHELLAAVLGSAAVVHSHSCPAACGILVPRPGIEPKHMSPALAGEFLTTGPPGKFLQTNF